MDKELLELRETSAHCASESERVQADCEARMLSLETRHKTELERERSGSVSVLRENEQLRSALSLQRHQAASGMDSLQAQLETHIAQLQLHTSELNVDAEPVAKSPRALSPASASRALTA